MTRSSRTLNRVILALLGLAAVAVAVVMTVPSTRGLVRPDAFRDETTLWATAAVCTLVVVLGLAWIATRGRGRTPRAVRTAELEIDTSVVAELLRASLATNPDVLSLGASAYTRRRERTVLLTLRIRRRPDIETLRGQLSRAIAAMDEHLGMPLPVVVHLTSGVRSIVARPRVAR